MKYSLRSLMIVVTLVCVVMGSVMGRVEYLRRWGAYHEREAKRFDDNAMRDFERTAKSLISASPGFSPSDARGGYYHSEMAKAFRQAAYRPWMPFFEPPECAELRKNHPELNPGTIPMKFSIRDLLLVTVIVALAGCMGDNSNDDDDIQYYEPGPEFRRSREFGRNGDLPNSPAPAPNPPKP